VLYDGYDSFYYFPTPAPVTANVSLTTFRNGAGTGCGLTAGGEAHCWSGNVSQGLVPLAGGLTFTSLSVGTAVACGVTSGSVAYCWGDNTWGQLGNGTTTASHSPVKVAGQP
jgi:hypothetical protein